MSNTWNWTARFTVGGLLALLFASVQLNWFGLLPGASQQLAVQAALLTLVGLFAQRISPIGMAIALVLAFVAIFVDQATAGIGITPLRFTPPSEFWTVTLSRVVVTWAAFPLLAWLFGRTLPPLARGLAVALALLPLPFIRYDNPGTILAALLDPVPGRYVVLSVPWFALCGIVAFVATAAVVVAQRRPKVTRPMYAALAAAILVVPLASTALATQQAATGLVIDPTSGGPLTEVQVRATFAAAGTPLFAVDGQRIVRNQYLFPFRTGVTADAKAAFLPGTAGALSAGAHMITVQLGGERRESNYQLVAPGGISLTLDADRHVVVAGRAGAPLRLLVDGPEGPELVEVSFDSAGSWRSSLALPEGVFQVIAESDGAWVAFDPR